MAILGAVAGGTDDPAKALPDSAAHMREDLEVLRGRAAEFAASEGEPSQGMSLRATHPNLYKAITVYGVVTIGLGLNFLLITPTFNQYGLSKIAGVVFIVIGVAKLVFLNVFRNLRLVRSAMAIGVGSLLFYGGVLTAFYFQTHKTSLQLPITYVGLSILLFTLLIEPPSNPASEKHDDENSQ